MLYQTTFKLAPGMIRRAIQRFLIRRHRLAILVLFVVLASGLIGLHRDHGALRWWGAELIAGAGLIGSLMEYRKTLDKARNSFANQRTTLRVEPSKIILETNDITCLMAWSEVKQIHLFPEVMLLFYHQTQCAIIPIDALGEKVTGFIETRVRENGGKVYGRF